MFKKILASLALALAAVTAASAQNRIPTINVVTSLPSGSCTVPNALEQYQSNLYVCYQGVWAASGAQLLSEEAFTGATVAARVSAACASVGSSKAFVYIPANAPSGDPSPVPDNCVLEDARQLWDMNINDTFNLKTGAFVFRATPTSSASTTVGRTTLSVIAEEMGGGSNGDSGNKTNQTALGVTQIRRTPGQGFGIAEGVRNTSRLGDTGLIQGAVFNGGNSENGGDDGTRVIDVGGYQESQVMTATVSTVNTTTGTVTFSAGTNIYLLGGLRFLLNDSSAYTAPSGCSISNVTLTCSSANLAQFCPGGVAPCGTIGTMLSPAVFVEDVDNDSASPNLKMIIALAQIASATQATIYYKSEGIVASSVPYTYPRAPFSVTGAAKFYYGGTIQDGSILYACAQNSATLCTVNVDAASSVNFHAGDAVEQPVGNALSIGGMKITVGQYLATPGNIASGPSGGGVGIVAGSPMPGDTGWSINGNFRYPFRAINWGLTASTGYTAPDIVMQMSGKGAPNTAFIQMNDTNGNTYEKLAQVLNHSGGSVYWAYDRAGSTICLDCFGIGDLKWTSDGTGRAEIGGSNPQTNLQLFQYIAASYAPTYTARQVNYYANPNANVIMERIDIGGVPVWYIKSTGSGNADVIVNNNNNLQFCTANQSGCHLVNYGNIVLNNQANTFGLFKQTFQSSSSTAGLNVAGVANDPTTLAQGDVWFNNTALRLKYNDGANTQSLATVTDIAGTPYPVTIVTTATVTVSSAVNAKGYFFNENATATTAVTFTLPTAAQGLSYCFKNSRNTTTPETGALTLQTSGTGQYIIYNGTNTASGGKIVSGGAAGDSICVVGRDATNWEAYVQVGSWTLF